MTRTSLPVEQWREINRKAGRKAKPATVFELLSQRDERLEATLWQRSRPAWREPVAHFLGGAAVMATLFVIAWLAL